MMRKMLTLVPIIALLISCQTGTLALGKTTIDPNTLPRVEKKDFWNLDDRLSQKVTYEAHRKTVLAIMDDLAKMTGITLNSGYNSKDWQVRDRKMLIFAKDMQLKDLMQSIARVMKFKWSRSETEPHTYRVLMDRRTLLDAEGEAYRAERKYEEFLTKRREVLADKMGKIADIDSAEIDSIKETDPYTYVLAKTGFAGPMAELLQQVPAAKEAFLNKSQAQIRGNQLPEEAYPTAALLAQAMGKLTGSYAYDSSGNDNEPIDVTNLEFNIDDPYPSSPFHRRFHLGWIAVQWKQGNQTRSRSFPLMDPETSMGKTQGLQYQMLMEMKPGDTFTPLSTTIDPEEIKQADFGETRPVHTADDFAIDIKQGVAPDTGVTYTTAEEMILAIAEATGANVVSDYLGKRTGYHTTPVGSNPTLHRLASCLEHVYDYNYWRHGNTLEFRDRYWFKKRSLQVPESYVEPWREHFKENGTLEIDDLAQMAVLVDNQEKYGVNINGDEVLGNESMQQAISWQRKQLGFYGSLTKEQRGALLTDEGLSQDSLTPKQLEDLKSFTRLGNIKDPLMMSVTRTPGRIDYRVTVPTKAGPGMIFSVWTPKYDPPKKEERAEQSSDEK